MLKLHLHMQVTLQQVQHHRLHVTPDPTAVPRNTHTHTRTHTHMSSDSIMQWCHTAWAPGWASMRPCCGVSVGPTPLDQLHDALCVHEEDFSVGLPLQGGRVAVQDVSDLREENNYQA